MAEGRITDAQPGELPPEEGGPPSAAEAPAVASFPADGRRPEPLTLPIDTLGTKLRRVGRGLVRAGGSVGAFARSYVTHNRPSVSVLFAPFVLLALVVFMRHPATNYIFDEQEALLANPYVNGVDGLRYGDAIVRDFWGLPPDASIGSYRPLPNFLWRALWSIEVLRHPAWLHLPNIVLHALNGALLGAFAYTVSHRRSVAWLSGLLFVTSAVITEAVSGIVGIADVLGGLGAILALWALRLPAWSMPIGVLAAMLVGLFSKESALVCVPLVPFAALLTAPTLHPARPARVMRALLALIAAAGAFVLYVELRKAWFPSPLPAELKEVLPDGASVYRQAYRDLLVWFHQAPLPKDPLNNPLAAEGVTFPYRLAGALRVYWRGLVQVVYPLHLSGDYSYPQEPVPETLYGWESVAGGAMMVLPVLAALVLPVVGWVRERRARFDLRQRAERATQHGAGDAFGDASLAAGPSGTGEGAWFAPPVVSPGPASWRPRSLRAGIVLVTAAMSAFGTEFLLVSRGGPSWVQTWPFALALLLMGLGFVVEGWRSVATPMSTSAHWPPRLVSPLLLSVGMMWCVVSYFPHSNIPVLLPTVRAERFWYFPVIGTSLVLALALGWLVERRARWGRWGARGAWLVVLGFVGFQSARAYAHAMDYRDDLSFWEATKDAVPRSAKAHLNYSVMKGARGDMETRLSETHIARELAPKWPMAHVYTGDTLCRMHRPDEAWPYYVSGFQIRDAAGDSVGANERSLIALALQCLYDEKALLQHDEELRALADEHPGSWLAYLAIDTLNNHAQNKGVDPKYRPRSYNEGPKDEDEETASATADVGLTAEIEWADSAWPEEDAGDGGGSGEPAADAGADAD